MTENNHPESILISGTTGRNLIHKPSIGGLSGGSWIPLRPVMEPGCEGCEGCCGADVPSFEDLHRDVRSGPFYMTLV